jgi:membrane associated rhomboid family serine protease
MGIYDRDYYRSSPRGGFGSFQIQSVTTWLIIINVVIFFADGMLKRAAVERAMSREADRAVKMDQEEWERQEDKADRRMMAIMSSTGPLEKWGYFSIDKAILRGQIWRLLTFQFLHASIGHLIGNMFGLFLFGLIVEGQFGPRRFLAFYLICGLAGAVMYVLLWSTGILINSSAVPMVGASAGVFGVLMAAAHIAPEMEIYIWLMPVQLRVLAWLYMGMALYVVLTSGMNAGGEAAHLGGGALGFLLIRNQHWLNFATPQRRAMPAARRRRVVGYQKDWSKDFNR